jgi:hypothetical protein
LQALPAVSEGGAGSGDFDSTGSGGGANGIGSEAGSAEPPVEDEFDLSDIMNEEVGSTFKGCRQKDAGRQHMLGLCFMSMKQLQRLCLLSAT